MDYFARPQNVPEHVRRPMAVNDGGGNADDDSNRDLVLFNAAHLH